MAITAARGLTILGDLKAGNPAKRFSGEIVLGWLTRKKEDIPWVFTLNQPIPDKKKRDFPLLTIKTYFLAQTNKRFILTGNVGRLFTIIIIVSVIVIFIVIVIVNVIVIDNDVVIAIIVIDIVIVHKSIDWLD